MSARIAVIGAGLMGHGIAQTFMVAGFEVSIWDPAEAARASVKTRIAEHLALMGLAHQPVEVRVCDSLEACVEGCDLLIEAVPEKMDIKRALLAAVNALHPECIIATNTSVLRITEIAEGSLHPERVVGTHWWNPPYLIPVVEVVRGEQTSEAVAQQVSAWLTQAGKTPVDVYRDVPGFVGNRMQFALMREAAYLVEEGICSAETVDLVASLTFGRRMAAVGPLRNADFIGLDLVCNIMDYLSPSLSDAKTAPALFRERVAAGQLGAKSGAGVYAWAGSDRDETEKQLLLHLIAAERAAS
ncbi:3-hydroxyacyl-CoA dehydrogenase family protein [Bordetella avium]|uniref:3-hydroxyacyl-CoA dehydrogenase family protein n=1 Tax=Bordetella avium TaxID=521 RepID=UPI000E0C193F|nr:3-hydroxyacyl-CoA dehydrogenase family protein [Bordetella avium]AZY51259.1 3-hydroxybutyryl-CoA dehydrogenase [Bordetella avium]RIQ14886.1 3-hydroxyacyl-CoA dehydrogenase family protein [Bordetella avium]RIQ18623.1 3-hydroxyacyl-CoA dehydrogenase family protein [Bordetella avium]RIQ35341.1 3-hydroxyacyl-CoA dehydrogenase family protein [Bordetella avium]RIQ41350.1 3-hydroxyacyl-CoA dehydrogenase family protein [Bordetella avium]